MKRFVCGIAVFLLVCGAGFAGTDREREAVSSFGPYQPTTPIYSEAVSTSMINPMGTDTRKEERTK